MQADDGLPAPKPIDESLLDQNSEWVAAVRERALIWYGEAGRELPWRASRDPYRILVSEMMLVQTTVAAVVPFFERFIRALSRCPRSGGG